MRKESLPKHPIESHERDFLLPKCPEEHPSLLQKNRFCNGIRSFLWKISAPGQMRCAKNSMGTPSGSGDFWRFPTAAPATAFTAASAGITRRCPDTA